MKPAMKDKAKRIKWLYVAALLCFLLSAVSLVMIPTIDSFLDEYQPFIRILIAALFWGGIAAGAVLTVITCFKIRPVRIELYYKGKISRVKLPGIIRFRREPLSIVAYALIILCAVLIVTDLIWRWLPPHALYAALAVLLLAFAAHCIFDGKNFYTYQYMKEGKKK